jgi:hypothetical protein
MPANTVAIIRPCGVERSNAMPFKATTDTRRASNSFNVANRSVVLRPQRDSSVTSTASICRTFRQTRPGPVAGGRKTGRRSRHGNKERRSVPIELIPLDAPQPLVPTGARTVAISLYSNWDSASGVPGTCHEPCYPARSMAYPRLSLARLTAAYRTDSTDPCRRSA